MTTLFYLLALISSVQSAVNFYISHFEASRVLGLQAELAYVRDGQVSDVAQHFTVPVPPNIQELCFVWENVDAKNVKYSIITKGSLPMMNFPLNISNHGSVPRKSQTFCITLPCVHQSIPSVDISMQINFTMQTNITLLNVLMKKECTTDEVLSRMLPIEDPSYMMYIAVAFAFAVILVTFVVVAIFFCPKQNCRQHISRSAITSGSAVYTSVEPPSPAEEPSTSLLLENYVQPQVNKTCSNSFNIQRTNVTISSILLEGTFGSVFQGTMRITAIESPFQEIFTDITIKTVKDNAADNQIQLMVQEGTRFQSFLHPNINPLIGIVDGDGDRPMLIYPCVSHGNLKRWLLQCKGSLDGSLPHPLCTQDLVTIALQILQGVQYLHQQNVVHKDLATRNCVIDENFHVKVTDTALSRDLFPNDYHCLGDNENRPIKWMAIESLMRREFSTASDMWSFGVVLWEVTTLALQPFVEVDPFEVGRVLRDGYRLTQPINCPDELYAIMAYCWALSPRERPTAAQLYCELYKFHQQLNEYI